MKIDIESLIGNCNSCYVGYSSNEKVRINGSSGGIVTSLLLFALQNKIISGCVVVRMDPSDPLKPEVFVARSKEDICSAQGSKYLPVSISEILKVIEKEDGQFAVVGLPCHIRALKMAMERNSEIKNKIVFTIGLICSRTVSFDGLYALLKKLKIDQSSIKEMYYRKGGWPGFFHLTQRNGLVTEIPYWKYWPFLSSYFFTPENCLYCTDVTNEMADISCGDAWLPDIKKNDKIGSSIIISRTVAGEKIIKDALSDGFIKLNPINPSKIFRSQWTPLYFKKLGGHCRIKLKKCGLCKGIFKILRKDGLFGLNAALFPLMSKKINPENLSKNKIMCILSTFYNFYGFVSSLIGFFWFKLYKIDDKRKNKEIKIYIIGVSHGYNKGWVAIVNCIISELKKEFPNAKFILESGVPEYDGKIYPDAEIVSMFSLRKFLKYNESDIIVYTGGDILCISLVTKFFRSWITLLSIFNKIASFIYWSITKKKVIIYAHSVGPYTTFFQKFLARFIFKRSTLITVRGALSARNLEKIGINNFHETADPAFLLNGISKKEVENIFKIEKINLLSDRHTIGLSISRSITLCKDNDDSFGFRVLTSAFEKIVDSLNVNLLLIPHSIGRVKEEDDRIINEKFLNYISPKYKSHIYILKQDYSPEELKGVIATCDMFIGYRMHANIAALSSGVPTLAISHGHKYFEIMQMFDMEKYILNAKNLSSDEVYSKVLELWNNRYDIKLQLKNNISKVQKLAELNAELAKKIMTTKK